MSNYLKETLNVLASRTIWFPDVHVFFWWNSVDKKMCEGSWDKNKGVGKPSDHYKNKGIGWYLERHKPTFLNKITFCCYGKIGSKTQHTRPEDYLVESTVWDRGDEKPAENYEDLILLKMI